MAKLHNHLLDATNLYLSVGFGVFLGGVPGSVFRVRSSEFPIPRTNKHESEPGTLNFEHGTLIPKEFSSESTLSQA